MAAIVKISDPLYDLLFEPKESLYTQKSNKGWDKTIEEIYRDIDEEAQEWEARHTKSGGTPS